MKTTGDTAPVYTGIVDNRPILLSVVGVIAVGAALIILTSERSDHVRTQVIRPAPLIAAVPSRSIADQGWNIDSDGNDPFTPGCVFSHSLPQCTDHPNAVSGDYCHSADTLIEAAGTQEANVCASGIAFSAHFCEPLCVARGALGGVCRSDRDACKLFDEDGYTQLADSAHCECIAGYATATPTVTPNFSSGRTRRAP